VAAASGCDAAQPVFQSASVLIAECGIVSDLPLLCMPHVGRLRRLPVFDGRVVRLLGTDLFIMRIGFGPPANQD
jgi:hypothetical protein